MTEEAAVGKLHSAGDLVETVGADEWLEISPLARAVIDVVLVSTSLSSVRDLPCIFDSSQLQR